MQDQYDALYFLGKLVRLYSNCCLGLILVYGPPLYLHLSKHYIGSYMVIIVEYVLAVILHVLYSRVITSGELLYMVLFAYTYHLFFSGAISCSRGHYVN